MKKRDLVVLEPQLEAIACLWTPGKRRIMACLYERWARELRVSANMLDRGREPKGPKHLKWLSPRKCKLN